MRLSCSGGLSAHFAAHPWLLMAWAIFWFLILYGLLPLGAGLCLIVGLVFVLEREKMFVFGVRREFLLNTNVINTDTKGYDGSAIGWGMKLMKRWLYFKITAKLGNSKRQHCSWQEKYIHMYKLGSTVWKSPRKKRRRKDRKDREVFYSHMNCRNASYAQGVKCWCSFWEAH